MGWISQAIAAIRSVTQTDKTDDELKAMILQAIIDNQAALGISVSNVLSYQFRPYEVDPTTIDPDAFENATNMTVDETLRIRDAESEQDGTIETKAILLSGELAFIRVQANIKGIEEVQEGEDPLEDLTLDFSVDKRNDEVTGNLGTWAVEEGMVATFAIGDLVDVSGIVSKYFSLKIGLAAGSALQIQDMRVELHVIPSRMMQDNMTRLIDTTAAAYYHGLWQKAIENGNPPETQRGLQQLYETHKRAGFGVLDPAVRGAAMGGAESAVAEKKHDDSVFGPNVSVGVPKGDLTPVDLFDRGTHKVGVIATIHTRKGITFY